MRKQRLRSNAMFMIHWVLAVIAAYLAFIAAMYFAQTWLLFPTRLAEAGRPQLPAAAEHLEVRTPDGERLVGVSIPAMGEADGGRTILGFGGNAWNGEAVALYLHGLFPDHDVVAFHHRGYRPSTDYMRRQR